MASPMLPDELWKRLEPWIPKPKENRHVQFAGRKPSEPRRVLTGILFVLKTGVPWRSLPATSDFPSGHTCLRRLRQWQKAGIWQRIFEILLAELQANHKIGFGRLWTALRCALPVEAKKPAQIPRIGANWEASTICSPMPTASR